MPISILNKGYFGPGYFPTAYLPNTGNTVERTDPPGVPVAAASASPTDHVVGTLSGSLDPGLSGGGRGGGTISVPGPPAIPEP